MLIQAYQESWVEDFHQIKKVLELTLVHLDISIEHVGSTSVPLLAAKPIIDIDIILGEQGTLEEVKNRLAPIGYYHNGDQGIPNREAFKRVEMTAPHSVLDSIAHHLYVCPKDSEELHRHILFRDYLRANEEARLQYQQLKYTIAAEAHQDRKQYAQLKEERARKFIYDIVEKAKSVKHSNIQQSAAKNAMR